MEIQKFPPLNKEFVLKMRNYVYLKTNEMKHENINYDQI